MLCPADRTPLIPHQREGVEARSCLQCHGLWFSRDALESLVGRTPPSATGEPPLPAIDTSIVMRRLACPTCAGTQLQTRMLGGVLISRCRECGGVWLDKTEVAKILSTRTSRSVGKPKSSGVTTGAAPGVSADATEGLGDAAPLVALETGGELGSALGDFLGSFLA
ncbi:MAG: hypothetical protein B9S33_07960 [Pedosphaera sp. Tous-C6FEB]|nr:MAG: hypothetical protein B9S33_07960 [Pedosphaera sp. Tous-C6FEB]